MFAKNVFADQKFSNSCKSAKNALVVSLGRIKKGLVCSFVVILPSVAGDVYTAIKQ